MSALLQRFNAIKAGEFVRPPAPVDDAPEPIAVDGFARKETTADRITVACEIILAGQCSERCRELDSTCEMGDGQAVADGVIARMRAEPDLRRAGARQRAFVGPWVDAAAEPVVSIGDDTDNGQSAQPPVSNPNAQDCAGDAIPAADDTNPVPTPETVACVTPSRAGGISVSRNVEKNGIEIRFAEKPDANRRAQLKSAGWRWSKFGQCWYQKWIPSAQWFADGLLREAVPAGRTWTRFTRINAAMPAACEASSRARVPVTV